MNFYNLRQAISESAAMRVETDTHVFFGGITESFNEFNTMMCESALDIDTDVRMGNEIMIEAVIAGVNESDFDTINESIGNSVIAKIKTFFKSIVEYIKGLIAKLKTYIASLSHNTNTWHKKMKAEVERAGRDSAITGDFTWNAYKWDQGKLEGLHGLAEKVAAVAIDSYRLDEIDTFIKDSVASYDRGVKMYNVAGVEKKEPHTTAELKGYAADALKDYKAAIGNALGVRGDVGNYRSALAENVKGKSESLQKDIGSKYNAMLDFIGKCTEKIEKISDLYEKSKDNFEKAISAIDNVDERDDIDMVDGISDSNKKALGIVKDRFVAEIGVAKSLTSYGQGVFNGICSLQVSLTKECAQSYMKTLSKLAMAKPKK